MMLPFKAIRGIVLSVFLVSGCALTNANVDLAYLPETGKKNPLGTVAPLNIALQVEDQRPVNEREWVGNKRNGFGMVTAWVKPTKEVTSTVRDALKDELVGSGHKVWDAKESATQGVLLHLALKRYWSDASMRFWDIEVAGTLSADISIRSLGADQSFLSKPLQGTFRESRQIATDGAYQSVLNGALTEFIRNFARDPSILRALQQAHSGSGN